MRRGLNALVLAATVLLPTVTAAETLVADLSRHLIAITADFDGTDVLVFGVADGGGDVVVVVRGPNEDAVVRRKARTLGVWLNTRSVVFEDVPSFYAIAATRPPAAMLEEAVRTRHGIGVDVLPLATAATVDAATARAFRAGLVRARQRDGLFPAAPAEVRFVGGGLFRTTLRFPASVRPGRYRVEVFSIDGGQVTAAQQSALLISKVGLEARLSDFARTEASLYGVGAIVFAVAAGWLAAVAFRRS